MTDTEYWLNNSMPSTNAQGCRQCREQQHTPVGHVQLVIDWCTSRLAWGMTL